MSESTRSAPRSHSRGGSSWRGRRDATPKTRRAALTTCTASDADESTDSSSASSSSSTGAEPEGPEVSNRRSLDGSAPRDEPPPALERRPRPPRRGGRDDVGEPAGVDVRSVDPVPRTMVGRGTGPPVRPRQAPQRSGVSSPPDAPRHCGCRRARLPAWAVPRALAAASVLRAPGRTLPAPVGRER